MKTTNKTLFVVLPLAAAVNAAWAQAASDEYTTLDTSVVSAAGYSQDVREAPASVSVIPAQELQTKPVRDLGTAIGDIPGVDWISIPQRWVIPRFRSADLTRAIR